MIQLHFGSYKAIEDRLNYGCFTFICMKYAIPILTTL